MVARPTGLILSSVAGTAIESWMGYDALAACNVLMASPVFYFMFARIYGEPLSVCTVRAFTGSLRIVPFMFSFYAFFAAVCPWCSLLSGTVRCLNDAHSEARAAVAGQWLLCPRP